MVFSQTPRPFRAAGQALGGQVFRYGLVGLAAAAGHYGTLVALVESGAAARLSVGLAGRLSGPVLASLAGFVVGGAISYGLNRGFTFRSTRAHGSAGPIFATVTLVAFALTGLLMHLFVDRAGLNYLLAQILTTGIVLVWTFVAHRFWTFRAA